MLTIKLSDFNEEQRKIVSTLIKENAFLKDVRIASLATFKDIDILIQKWDMVKKDSLFYNDFYKRFEKLFPDDYNESYKVKNEIKH